MHKRAEEQALPLAGVSGLGVCTLGGEEIEIQGPVTYHPGFEIYYCGEKSWPRQIVRALRYVDGHTEEPIDGPAQPAQKEATA